jgi:hypothetical protein
VVEFGEEDFVLFVDFRLDIVLHLVTLLDSDATNFWQFEVTSPYLSHSPQTVSVLSIPREQFEVDFPMLLLKAIQLRSDIIPIREVL